MINPNYYLSLLRHIYMKNVRIIYIWVVTVHHNTAQASVVMPLRTQKD